MQEVIESPEKGDIGTNEKAGLVAWDQNWGTLGDEGIMGSEEGLQKIHL